MKLTMNLRWVSTVEVVPIPGSLSGLCTHEERSVLQQFVEIGDDESDITLPKEVGPDGNRGRWMDVQCHPNGTVSR